MNQSYTTQQQQCMVNGISFYHTKNNSFKRNLQRVTKNDSKLPTLLNEFDAITDQKIIKNNTHISEIIQGLKGNYSNTTITAAMTQPKIIINSPINKPKEINNLLNNDAKNQNMNKESKPATSGSQLSIKTPQRSAGATIRNLANSGYRRQGSTSSMSKQNVLTSFERSDGFLISPSTPSSINILSAESLQNKRGLTISTNNQKNVQSKNSLTEDEDVHEKAQKLTISNKILMADKQKKLIDINIKRDSSHLLDNKKYFEPTDLIMINKRSLSQPEIYFMQKSDNLNINLENLSASEIPSNLNLKLETNDFANKIKIIAEEPSFSVSEPRGIDLLDLKNSKYREHYLQLEKLYLLNEKASSRNFGLNENSPISGSSRFNTKHKHSKTISYFNPSMLDENANPLQKSNNDLVSIEKRFSLKPPSIDNQIIPHKDFPLASGITLYENFSNFLPKKLSTLQTEIGESPLSSGKNPIMDKAYSTDMLVSRIYKDKEKKLTSQAKYIEGFFNSEDFLELRKEIPCLMSHVPASRQETVLLSKWIDNKIQLILEDDKLATDQKSRRCDDIYNICLNEIFRQVTIDCYERGMILTKIWISYLEYFDMFKQQLEHKIQKIKEESEISYNRVHKMYKDLLLERDSNITTLKEKIDKLTEDNTIMSVKYHQLNKENKDAAQKVVEYKNFIIKCKKHITNLIKENESYKNRVDHVFSSRHKINMGNLTPTTLSKIQENAGYNQSLASQKNNLRYFAHGTGQGAAVGGKQNVKNTNKNRSPEKDRGDNGSFKGKLTDKPEKISKFNDKEGKGTHGKELGKDENNTSEDSNASSVDLVIDESPGKEEVVKVEQLNLISNQNTDLNIQFVDHSTQVIRADFIKTNETQTDFSFLDEKYRGIFKDLKIFDELIIEYKFKQELDAISEAKLTFPRHSIIPESRQEKIKLRMQEREVNDFVILSRRSLECKNKLEREDDKGSNLKKKKTLRPYSADYKIKILRSNWEKLYQQQLKKKAKEDLKRNLLMSLDENAKKLFHITSDNKILDEVKNAINKGIIQLNNNTLIEEMAIIDSSKDRKSIWDDHSLSSSRSISVLDYNEDSITSGSDQESSIEKIRRKANIKKSLPPEIVKKLGNLPGVNLKKLPNMDKVIEQEKRKTIRVSLKAQIAAKDKKEFWLNFFPQGEKNKKRLNVINTILQSKDTIDIKAALLHIIKIYNLQKEKIKVLNDAVTNLAAHIVLTKNTSESLNKEIASLQSKIKEEEEKLKQIHEIFTKKELEKQQEIDTGSKLCPHCKKDITKSKMDSNDHDDGINLSDLDDELLDMDDLAESDDDQEDEDGKKGTTGLKRKPNKGNTMKKLTSVTESQILSRKSMSYSDKRTNAAPLIIQKLKVKKLGKFKNFMPMKQVLKLITQIYEERVEQTQENPSTKEDELSCFIYNLFLHNFGFKKLAEQKLIVLVLSLKRYLHIVRINLFARFLGVLEGTANYTLDEFNKCIELFEFVKTSNIGTTIANNDADLKHYAPFLRVNEFIKNFSENKLSQDEYQEFKQEFENLKENDPKNINKYGIIDLDLSALKLLAKYQLVCNRTKQYVINAFKAADLDGNKTCSLKEFVLLYKYIEASKYDYDFVESIFEENVDVWNNQEKALTFNKFTILCVEYTLFSDSQQDSFLKIREKDEINIKFQKLKQNWLTEYTSTLNKLKSLKKASTEEINYWLGILEVLDQRIVTETELKPFLIAYNIMIQEVEELKEIEEEKLSL